MQEYNEGKQILNRLSKLIVNILSKDKDVMGMLYELRDNNTINSETMLGLILKIDDMRDLSGVLLSADDSSKEWKNVEEQLKIGTEKRYQFKRYPENIKRKAAKTTQIDGYSLTEKEKKFQRFASDRFDQKSWLKKLSIKW